MSLLTEEELARLWAAHPTYWVCCKAGHFHLQQEFQAWPDSGLTVGPCGYTATNINADYGRLRAHLEALHAGPADEGRDLPRRPPAGPPAPGHDAREGAAADLPPRKGMRRRGR